MKKLFFLLLPMLAAAWLAGLGGCRKCKIEGRVLEFGTEKPIPNATAILSECEGEVLGSFTCTEKARTLADADGTFTFDNTGFAVAAEAADYWPSGDDFVLIPDDCPEPMVHLYPNAWLEVTIRNESGAYLYFPYSNNSGNPGIQLSVGRDSVISNSLVLGNKVNVYTYGVKVSPTDIGTSTTLKPFCQGHETTKITITY